jgi:hypothetical protein
MFERHVWRGYIRFAAADMINSTTARMAAMNIRSITGAAERAGAADEDVDAVLMAVRHRYAGEFGRGATAKTKNKDNSRSSAYGEG